jgi:hypothetical protein
VSGALIPDYCRDRVLRRRKWRQQGDTLARALGQFTVERLGGHKVLAADTGWSQQKVSALFMGLELLTAAKVNRILDACGASEDERATFNAWGAREAGWRF